MKLIIVLIFVFSFIVQAEEDRRIDKIESDIDDLKIRAYDNHLSWNSDILNSFDSYDTKGYSVNPADRNLNLLFTRLRLHAKTLFSKEISAYFTFSGSHYYNQALTASKVSIDSPIADAQGYSLKVDRAFVNYELLAGKLAFSFGRLPTMFGPPQNIPSGDERLGTYPSLAYSIPLDGLATSWNISKSLNFNDSLVMRVIYAPLSSVDTENAQVGQSVSTRSPNVGKLTSNGQSGHWMIDYEKNNLKYIEKIKFIFQGTYISFGRTKSIEARGVLDTTLQGDRNIYEVSSTGSKTLDVRSAVAHLEFENISNTNITFYSSLKKSMLFKRADLKAVIIEDNESSVLGQKGAEYNIGGFLTGNSNQQGFQQLYGLGWQNKSQVFNMGIEYINTHIGALPSAIINLHPTDFYTMIGKGEHLYVNYYIIPKVFNILIGYMHTRAEQRFTSYNYLQDDYSVKNLYLSSMVRF